MTRRDQGSRPSGGAAQAAERAAQRVRDAAARVKGAAARDLEDAVDRAMAQWAREMPEVETKGAEVLDRARDVALAARRATEANVERHGLDAGEYDVLAALRRAGVPFALRPTALYTALMISSGGLTARLDRLEAAGLIRRRRADDDGRSQIVELTHAGRKKIEAAFKSAADIENQMVEGLSETERADLVRLLRKLVQNMR